MNVFKLEEYLEQYEFSAQYLLCCSDAETFTMADIIKLADDNEKERWNNLSLGYTEVPGLPALRSTIAHTLYNNLTKEHIITFAGASDAIMCALYTLIEPTDHVIVLMPCYQSLFEIPLVKKAAITTIALEEENGWKINLETIKHAIKQNTKCIIINFPHNPTGSILTSNELQGLIDICESHDIWLFSDEVYRGLGTNLAQPAACLYKKALSINVMSKSFGLAGLRIGWIACQHQTILKKISQTKHYTSICNSAPSEILTMIALNHQNVLLERNNAIVNTNLNILDDFFNRYKDLFSWVRPQAGCVGFVNYKSNTSVDDFCKKLVADYQVLLMPASIYNHDSNHFRIGFGRKNMPECLYYLEKSLHTI